MSLDIALALALSVAGITAVYAFVAAARTQDLSRTTVPSIVLLVLAMASVLFALIGVPQAWGTPLILLALLAVIQMIRPIDELSRDLRYLRAVSNGITIQVFRTTPEFFSALADSVSRATSTLDLTHIRDQPPSEFGAQMVSYSDAIVRWVRDEDGSARRIIAVNSEAMFAWALQLRAELAGLPRYQVRVVEWAPGTPSLNFAILDGRAVYLSVTGSTLQRTRGLGVEDQDVGLYFSEYYETLWRSAVDLDEFLRDKDSGRAR